jgi:hypothetical protein
MDTMDTMDTTDTKLTKLTKLTKGKHHERMPVLRDELLH